MNRFRILLSLVLVAILCVSLIGCGEKQDETQKEEPNNTPSLTDELKKEEEETLKSELENTIQNISCEHCHFVNWGDKDRGGFQMLVRGTYVTCFWSPETGRQFVEVCEETKTIRSECTCERHYSHTSGTSWGESTHTDSVGQTHTDSVGQTHTDSVGQSSSVSIGQSETHSESLGRPSSESWGTSIGTSTNTSTSTTIGTSTSTTVVSKCQKCKIPNDECICDDECKEAGCSRYLADCGFARTEHKCSKKGEPLSSHSHDIYEHSPAEAKVVFEETDDGYVVFCLSTCTKHQIKFPT